MHDEKKIDEKKVATLHLNEMFRMERKNKGNIPPPKKTTAELKFCSEQM